MIQRIRQFLYAVFGRLDAEANTFVRCYLSKEEQKLFYAMHEADQFHAWRVARTAQKKYLQYNVVHSDAYILLTRCALLHDIGREKGMADVWGKVLSVLVYRFLPHLVEYFIRETNGHRGRIGTALYICQYHPILGANKLRKIGAIKEAEIISQHQKKPAPEDPLVLAILKEADGEN